jgi:hypothetical protein
VSHKANRDRLHHHSIVSPKQRQRMANGYTETLPHEMLTVAERDRRAGMVRRAIEDMREQRMLERITGNAWE